MDQEYNVYQERNDAIRFETLDELNDKDRIPLHAFFRRIGLPHVYSEVIAPTLREGTSLVVVAVHDRPWPPWGIGAKKIQALSLAHPLGENSASLSNIFVSHEDQTNIGLMSSLFKEMLQELIRRDKTEVSYVVLEGSVLAPHVLSASGFYKTEDLYLTEQARYNLYAADAQDLLNNLGLADISTPGLLAHQMPDGVLERNALFHGMTQLASRSHWYEELAISEIIANLGVLVQTLPPGGPPPPGTQEPPDIGEIDIVIGPVE